MPEITLTDDELLDHLKRQGAMWFNNENLLLLEELFRRYKQCQASTKGVNNAKDI